MTVQINDSATCPCRTAVAGAKPSENSERRSYANCCKPWHVAGYAGLGATPEITMRSRYTAYVLHDESYLLNTWHETTRPVAVEFPSNVEWHGLSVMGAKGSTLDSTGEVEFTARFRRDDAHLELHELSTFSQIGGRWFYIDGVDPDTHG